MLRLAEGISLATTHRQTPASATGLRFLPVGSYIPKKQPQRSEQRGRVQPAPCERAPGTGYRRREQPGLSILGREGPGRLPRRSPGFSGSDPAHMDNAPPCAVN
ncbi:unnamed protein product [Bubo scandiacus]